MRSTTTERRKNGCPFWNPALSWKSKHAGWIQKNQTNQTSKKNRNFELAAVSWTKPRWFDGLEPYAIGYPWAMVVHSKHARTVPGKTEFCNLGSLLNTSKMNVNGYGPVWVKFWATWKHGVCFLIQSKILWLAKIDPSYPNGFVKQCDISELVKLVARSSCLIPQVGHANLSFSWFPKVPLTGAHLHTRQWWPQDVHCWIQLPLTNGLRSRHLSGLYLKRFHKPITIKGCVGR